MSFSTSSFESVERVLCFLLCANALALIAYCFVLLHKRKAHKMIGADRRKGGVAPPLCSPRSFRARQRPALAPDGSAAHPAHLSGALAQRFSSRGSRGSLRSARLDGGLPLLGARAPTPYVVGRPRALRAREPASRAASIRPAACWTWACCRKPRAGRPTLAAVAALGGGPSLRLGRDAGSRARSARGPAGLRPPGRHRRLGAPRSHDGLRPVGSCLPGSPRPSCPVARPRLNPLRGFCSARTPGTRVLGLHGLVPQSARKPSVFSGCGLNP